MSTRPLLASLALASAAGCSLLIDTSGRCLTAADCLPGSECTSGRCRPTGSGGGAAGGGSGADAGLGGGADGGGRDGGGRDGGGRDGGGADGGGSDGGGGAVGRPDGGPDGGAADAGRCGDRKLGAPETCDDGNAAAGDGCSAQCASEGGWVCAVPGTLCVRASTCGDGLLGGVETCDDLGTAPGDGCSAGCTLEPGWRCPTAGAACVATRCGDSLRAGLEECDDGNAASSDGCSASCVIEEGWDCPTLGAPCQPTVCGNGLTLGTEQCDDGNHDQGDGCDPTCHVEPRCADGGCQPVCGDGVKLPSEACDDGNTRRGDGCSPTCAVEAGFACESAGPASAPFLSLPIVYRDFLPSGADGGHPDFEDVVATELGIVTGTLGNDGKPVYASSGVSVSTHGAGPFSSWYRDVPGVNRTVVDRLVVPLTDAGSYVFDDQAFFPLDGRGWQSDGTEPSRSGHNFSFTSELRTWFSYAGGEVLDFRGDDDVWVFINRRLAVDLGGVHGPASGTVTLDAPTAASLGLSLGGIYEVAVFQAERHVTGSSYRLTLRGFNAQRSTCAWTCGDGVTTRFEVCDDGFNDGRYGGCLAGCQQRAAFCGNGVIDASGGEVCDDGLNAGAYGQCAPGCRRLAGCGDGVLQAANGEQCDDANRTAGDGCNASCRLEGP